MTEVTTTENAFTALNPPSLKALAFTLRHPALWPPGFVWDYRACSTCAIGLAHRLWDEMPDGRQLPETIDELVIRLNAPFEVVRSIFIGWPDWVPLQPRNHALPAWWTRSLDRSAVTPEMVAHQIDLYLERKAHEGR